MKSKASLSLMEQLIMILVFALAAALCLQAFAAADRQSKGSASLDWAVLEAQNAVETLKSCGGDYEAAATLYGGSWDGESWVVNYNAGCLRVSPQHSEISLLGRAKITVTDKTGAILCSLSTAWQKEDPGHG